MGRIEFYNDLLGNEQGNNEQQCNQDEENAQYDLWIRK